MVRVASMNMRRGSTSSPISICEDARSASIASSTLHLQQRPRLRIHRGVAELLGVHLAESLVALNVDVCRVLAVWPSRFDDLVALVDVVGVVLVLALGHAEERRLGDVDVARPR